MIAPSAQHAQPGRRRRRTASSDKPMRQRAPARQPARLQGERTLQDVVEPRRAQVEIVGVAVARAHAALREAHRRRRCQQQAVERAHALDLPPGSPGGGAQRGARVAAVMVVGLVVARPQGLVGGHGDQQPAAGARHPPQLDERGDVVGDVLDHVQAGDEVKRRVLPGKLLQPADAHLAQAAPTGQLGRVGVELDPAHLAAVVDKLHQGAARAAAGVEDARAGGQGQAVQLGPDHTTAAAIPPVVLVDRERRFHHRLVHGSVGT